MAFTVPFSKKSENTSDAIFVVKKKQKTEQLCGIGNFSGWETGKESTTNRAIDVGARGGGHCYVPVRNASLVSLAYV